MNQELMTLDFWQDTVIYESKTFPVGTLACDALNVPADTIAKANEQCEKINLLLGTLNAGKNKSASIFPDVRCRLRRCPGLVRPTGSDSSS